MSALSPKGLIAVLNDNNVPDNGYCTGKPAVTLYVYSCSGYKKELVAYGVTDIGYSIRSYVGDTSCVAFRITGVATHWGEKKERRARHGTAIVQSCGIPEADMNLAGPARLMTIGVTSVNLMKCVAEYHPS